MSTMAPPHYRLPAPHPGQQYVWSHLARLNFLVAGRRWRKTTFAMSVMVEAVLDNPTEYVWAAPTYPQVRRGWQEMQRATQGIFTFNEGRMEAHTPDGGIINFLSLTEYDNKRGYTSFGTVIDEATEVPREAYDAVLRPMLSDTNGWLLAFGTPKGRNWFHDEVMRAQHGDIEDAAAWITPTLGATIGESGELLRTPHPLENPHFKWESLQYEYQTLPERVFRQEYLAEFLDDAGGVFRNVEACVTNDTPLDGPPNRVFQYVIGIDLAKHNDYTVLCVGDLREHKLVAFDRFNKADWPLQKARIIEAAHKWNDAMIWMDATGVGDPIYDDLRTAGLRIHPYKFTASTKEQLINHAVLLVEQRGVTYPRVPVLIDELKALQYFRTPSGNLRISAPEGMHDDAAMAFALMCWPFGHGSSGIFTQATMEQLAPRRTSPFGGLAIRKKVF